MQVIRKIGKSKGVIIPKPLLEKLGLEEGTLVDISVLDKQLVLKPVKHRYSLMELVEQMSPENSHELIDFGPDVGAEIVEYEVEEKKQLKRNPK